MKKVEHNLQPMQPEKGTFTQNSNQVRYRDLSPLSNVINSQIALNDSQRVCFPKTKVESIWKDFIFLQTLEQYRQLIKNHNEKKHRSQ